MSTFFLHFHSKMKIREVVFKQIVIKYSIQFITMKTCLRKGFMQNILENTEKIEQLIARNM